jgi:hypothetical protein
VAAALPAIVQGPPLDGAVSMGAHMWLDRAMRGADALAAELKAQGVDLTRPMYRTIPLEDRLRALLTGQQWALIDMGGEAVIWFRELPLDVAELWVVTAKAGEEGWARVSPSGKASAVDWSRPDDFYADAFCVDNVRQSPDDHLYRVVGRVFGIGGEVFAIGGKGRGI